MAFRGSGRGMQQPYAHSHHLHHHHPRGLHPSVLSSSPRVPLQYPQTSSLSAVSAADPAFTPLVPEFAQDTSSASSESQSLLQPTCLYVLLSLVLALQY